MATPMQAQDFASARRRRTGAERAAAEASWHEEQANRWRRYQAACEQGLNCVGDQPPQPSTAAYR